MTSIFCYENVYDERSVNMKTTILAKNAIKCKKCGDVIESNYRHNFVTCSCGACSVDGGFDYLRRCGNPDDYEEVCEYKEIDVEPKYKVGDTVEFEYYYFRKVGVIKTVDIHPFKIHPYYNIMVDSEPMFYKDVSEEHIIGLVK